LILIKKNIGQVYNCLTNKDERSLEKKEFTNKNQNCVKFIVKRTKFCSFSEREGDIDIDRYIEG